MAGWAHEYGLLQREMIQRRDEGAIIPPWLEARIAELNDPAHCWNEERSALLWQALAQLPESNSLAEAEPNDLGAIRALRPAGPRDLEWCPSDLELGDKLHGAWTGRCVGCALGRPVESDVFGMAVENGRTVGRQRIRALLTAQNEWPLRDYFRAQDNGSQLRISKCFGSTRESIVCMEADDDIHYTLVGLGVLETCGPDFSWHEVARYWSEHIPYNSICTAETQAILNFWNRSIRWGDRDQPNTAAMPAWTRSHRNPYREWIGAQIRADGWAWACAGKPQLAAEFAYRDASWTHTRNGIYGAMFFAAVQAAAFVVSNPEQLIQIGLSEIPYNCRLAQWLRKAVQWARSSTSFEAALDRMEQENELIFMSPVHTINNAVLCVLALWFHADIADAACCAVVSAGLDTDCNGATVGSIVGAIHGKTGDQQRMSSYLHDRVEVKMIGFQQTTMAALAHRHADVWNRVDDYHASQGNAAANTAAGSIGVVT